MYLTKQRRVCVCVCVCVCVFSEGVVGKEFFLKKKKNEVGHGLYKAPAENSADIFISHCHTEDLHNF